MSAGEERPTGSDEVVHAHLFGHEGELLHREDDRQQQVDSDVADRHRDVPALAEGLLEDFDQEFGGFFFVHDVHRFVELVCDGLVQREVFLLRESFELALASELVAPLEVFGDTVEGLACEGFDLREFFEEGDGRLAFAVVGVGLDEHAAHAFAEDLDDLSAVRGHLDVDVEEVEEERDELEAFVVHHVSGHGSDDDADVLRGGGVCVVDGRDEEVLVHVVCVGGRVEEPGHQRVELVASDVEVEVVDRDDDSVVLDHVALHCVKGGYRSLCRGSCRGSRRTSASPSRPTGLSCSPRRRLS